MAVAARRETRMSLPDYRDWAETRPDHERWELLDGEPVLMSPPSERHQIVVANLIRRLGDLADTKGCRVVPGIAVLSAAMNDFAPVPDVVVRCGPPLPDGYASDPVLVAEVLSPSTMSLDRGRKTDFYRSIESLKAFLIVYQDEPRVEVWRRGEGTAWRKQALGLDGVLDLPEIGGDLTVASVFAGIAF
ncbi:Uma2 family endonuclease [Methylobacterium sp. sgz302541]|uniref:Uma2 family endonuclease n=1 Tax=unclassified Methylobacterium TaxID=2615210 RepID=UPI003D356BC7